MTAIRRTALTLALALTAVLGTAGSTAPAHASFSDSASRSTTVATDEPGAPVPATMVVVEPGQTLWDLAAEANPNGNGQQTVADIMRLNSIESAGGLQAGDTIAVPLYK